MKAAVAWFAENHVAANLLMLFVLVAGIATGVFSKLEVFPETTLDRINVTVAYPGASPAEVEEGVITRIEEAVAGLDGIKKIESTAREGVASVSIEVIKDYDAKKLLDDVKSAVDRITTLPGEAEKPVVSEGVIRSQVIALAVYGDASERTLKNLAERLKDDLTNLPGITQADLFGTRESEIHIEISEEDLRRYGLTLGQAAQAVAQASLDLPAGNVKTPNGEILVRTKGRRYHADDYNDVPVITKPGGAKVTLGQIADLKEGFEDVDLEARFQGKPAALIFVYRVGDQNALDVAQTVKDFVGSIQKTLPHGVQVASFMDRSVILKSRLDLLTRNMLWGLLLVALLLGLFLNVRLAFWVTLGIPISFAFALLFLPRLDVSINMISLFAFIMVLGIVVDDAIVVGENVFRKREKGMPPLTASVEGAVEVGRPVVFSVLTTMVAFWPLLMGGGVMGKIMRNIPIVVMLTLAGSLLESLFVLPSHLAGASKAGRRKTAKPRTGYVARGLQWFINKPYASFLKLCLSWRYATAAFCVAILVVSVGLYAGGRVKFTFFPPVEGDTLQCFVTMPVGTPKARTEQVIRRIEQKMEEAAREVQDEHPELSIPLVEYTVAMVGGQFGRRGNSDDSGGNVGQIWVQLLESEKRPKISSEAVTRLWRQKVGMIPDADSLSFTATLHSAGAAIEIHLSAENYGELTDAADELKQELQKYPGVSDVEDSFQQGKKEVQLKLKPAARALGVTLNELAAQVRHAFYGAEALRFQRDKDEVKVLVRYPESERKSLESLESMRIRLGDGSEVPFRQVAEATMEQGYATIDRVQRMRVVKVLADVNEDVANAANIRKAVEDEYLPRLMARYPGLRYSIEGEGREQKESMGDVFLGFGIALFGIYVLLAIPFRSFFQPFIVMTAIPFGLVGAIFGHLFMGYNLSILSLFGIVGLSGVVVNDSLVMVHTVNRLREKRDSVIDAVNSAATQRFRAVILTSLTTFAGLYPMLQEKSLQARFLIPMAISLGFGVLFATVITLVLIPCLYLILEDAQKVIKKVTKVIF